eukprot:scaffold120875_cov55-Phaeocystis_antarctica.AAC.2
MRIPPVAGNKLDSSEANCVANCAGRFLDSSVFVVNRMMAAKHATPWPDLCRASSGPASRHRRSSAAQGRTAALSPHPPHPQPSQPAQPSQLLACMRRTACRLPIRQRLSACTGPSHAYATSGHAPPRRVVLCCRPQPSPVRSLAPSSARASHHRPQPALSLAGLSWGPRRLMCYDPCAAAHACADAFPFGAQAKRQQGQ